MKVAMRKVGSVAILDIEGNMSIGAEAALEEAFRQLVESDARQLLVNMSNVGFLDSGGLAETIRFYKRAADRKSTVRLVMHPQSKPHQIFRLTGLTKVFEIYDAEGEALDSFSV